MEPVVGKKGKKAKKGGDGEAEVDAEEGWEEWEMELEDTVLFPSGGQSLPSAFSPPLLDLTFQQVASLLIKGLSALSQLLLLRSVCTQSSVAAFWRFIKFVFLLPPPSRSFSPRAPLSSPPSPGHSALTMPRNTPLNIFSPPSSRAQLITSQLSLGECQCSHCLRR